MFNFLRRLLGIKKKSPEDIIIFAESVRNKHLMDLILQAFFMRKITSIINPSKEGMERRTEGKEGLVGKDKTYYSIDEIWIKGEVFGRVEVWLEGDKVKANKFFPEFQMKEEPKVKK